MTKGNCCFNLVALLTFVLIVLLGNRLISYRSSVQNDYAATVADGAALFLLCYFP